jgi:O-antigen ligase
MFAAAIPISFAGWGMRELGAVAALGAIGMSAGSAMSASVLIGVLSLLTVGLAAATTLAFKLTPPTAGLTESGATAAALTSAMVWTLPLLTALLMFFQIRAPITGGFVTLSPADLFATVSGTTFFFHVAADVKLRKLLKPLIWFASAGTLIFLLAYANGFWSFGSNQWATSKMLGWLLLLAYLATGATVSLYVGAAGITATALTMLTASATIIAMDAVTHYPSHANFRWEGVAGNPNAFAFQIAVCFAVGFAIVRPLKIWPALAALLMAGAYFSLSRSGTITLIIVSVIALAFRMRHWKGLAAALAVFATIVLAWSFNVFELWPFDAIRQWQHSLPEVITSAPELHVPVRAQTGIAFSDNERWTILQNAWTIFTQHPLTGAGLGYYYDHFTRPDGSSVVIHSTPLWLLAEIGLFGTLVFVVFGAAALAVAIKKAWRGNDAALMFVLTAVVFCAMGAIQDMFYQRTMWFVAGLSMGALLTGSSPRSRLQVGRPSRKAR